MARLFEYQSKSLLKEKGIPIPRGGVAGSPDEAVKIAGEIDYPVVLKIQAWVTGRANLGGIRFAENADEVKRIAGELLGMKVKNFTVEKILVEEKLDIEREFFAGIIVDDAEKSPLVIFSSIGGTGIEEIAREHPESIAKSHVDPLFGFKDYHGRELARKAGITGKLIIKVGSVLSKLYNVMKSYDARSAEINPLALTKDGNVVALDCHITVDDYAVYRHPELGIEIAREFDRPATELEKIAYRVEKKDYRGTFYFFQMVEKVPPDGKHIGFHGAGGGGSMMSMDAVLNAGFKIANFCDTSGNPPASKVYRAAKIILSQPNIVGYFASGSGVASQEQFHSARGFVKAFLEERPEIPAVLRLGGNFEEKAIEILHTYLKELPAGVEGYGRDDSPDFCATRLKELVEKNGAKLHIPKPYSEYTPKEGEYSFETITGRIYVDHELCDRCETKGCVSECPKEVLKIENGRAVLNMDPEEVKKGKCTECLACEIYCQFHGAGGLHIVLPIPGLKEYRERILKEIKEG